MVILGLWEQLHNPNLNLSNSIGLEMKLDTKRLLCLRKSGLRTQMQLVSSLNQAVMVELLLIPILLLNLPHGYLQSLNFISLKITKD